MQHVNEHETLQQLQRYALNREKEKFFELLLNIDGDDKRKDIIELCNMHEEMNANGACSKLKDSSVPDMVALLGII